MYGGTVSDNTLINVNLSLGSFGGGLMGATLDGTVSSNVVIGATIYSTSGIYIGGLVGDHNNSISSCFAAASISGGSQIGGLAGISSGTITDSYFKGSVTAADSVTRVISGGVANGGNLTNVYTTAMLINGTTTYGLAASTATVSDSYWDSTISGTTTAGAGVGKSTSELQTPITATGIYADWSTDVWDFGTDSQYPALKNLRLSVADQRSADTSYASDTVTDFLPHVCGGNLSLV